MKFALILTVFSYVGCIQSVFSWDHDDHTSKECVPQPPSCSKLQIETYAVYLVGFFMLFMIFVIIYLIYALWKAKKNQYKIMTDLSQPSYATANQQSFSRQESEVPICPTTAITPVEEIIVDDSFSNNTDCLRVMERNGASTSTINRYESKVLPVIKKSLNSHLMLPPEQMREICKGVLQNRKSNKDLEGFLDSFERRPSRESKKGLARDKSASTPQLDLLYDMLPPPVPSLQSINVQEDDNQNASDNEEVNTKANTEEEETTCKTNDSDNEHLDDIYDSPPVASPNSKKIVYEDTEYLIVIDPALDTDPEKDPAYINAKKNDYVV